MGLIQLPISYFDYHDLHLKSTTAMKLFRLTLSGSYKYSRSSEKGTAKITPSLPIQ